MIVKNYCQIELRDEFGRRIKNKKKCLRQQCYINNNEGKMGEKKLPVIYKRKEQCCGCTACYAICPMSGEEWKIDYEMNKKNEAIIFVKDYEGFLYPVIDASVCVRCYQCVEVCPYSKN